MGVRVPIVFVFRLVPCSGCPNLVLGKCKNPHAPSQGPQAPVLPRKKGLVLGRPAPAATNLPDPPPPLRFGPLRLGPPEPSPAELARASEEGGAASYVSFLQSSSSSSLSSSVSSFSSTSSGLPAPSPAPIPFDSPPLFSMVEADFDLLTRLNSPNLPVFGGPSPQGRGHGHSRKLVFCFGFPPLCSSSDPSWR